MTVAFPTLILSRRPRQIGSGWNDARSWFGGAPQLGGQSWPRGGPRQMPLYFAAEIDLAELAREVGRVSPSLADGALAFFIGPPDEVLDCAVVHVPRSELGEATAPPSDAPAVMEPGGDILPETFDDAAPRLFPRWPIDIMAPEVEPIAVADDTDEDTVRELEDQALGAAVYRHFIPRRYFFNAPEAYKLLGDGVRQFWWHSAHHYLACLRMALRELPNHVERQQRLLDLARTKLARLRPTGVTGVLSALGFRSKEPNAELKKAEDWVTKCEASLAELEQPAAEFERFVQEVADWVRGTDQWQMMPPDAADTLASIFERGRTTFREFTRYRTPYGLDDLETETLVALATADDQAYATMPEAMRTLINTRYLLPTRAWHQMFGRGVDIQANAAAENEGNVMLLQLVYDDMMHWKFGDMGAYQFWIAPDDLARQNWAAVRLTFECH